MWAKRKGFTIVELLVVIVVIAILASISIVAYNGIQGRAQNVSAAATVRNYQQMFRIMLLDGTIPNTNACLGPSTLYPGNPGCAKAGQYANSEASVNTLLTNTGMPNQPALPYNEVGYKHIMYGYSFYGARVLLWDMPGNNQDCGVQPVMSNNGSGWGFYGAKNSINNTTSTACFVGIQ